MVPPSNIFAQAAQKFLSIKFDLHLNILFLRSPTKRDVGVATKVIDIEEPTISETGLLQQTRRTSWPKESSAFDDEDSNEIDDDMVFDGAEANELSSPNDPKNVDEEFNPAPTHLHDFDDLDSRNLMGDMVDTHHMDTDHGRNDCNLGILSGKAIQLDTNDLSSEDDSSDEESNEDDELRRKKDVGLSNEIPSPEAPKGNVDAKSTEYETVPSAQSSLEGSAESKDSENWNQLSEDSQGNFNDWYGEVCLYGINRFFVWKLWMVVLNAKIT
jgi:hypothetical protein